MFALSVHALISITISTVSLRLFSHIWGDFLSRQRDRLRSTGLFFRSEPTPLVFLSLVWALTVCGQLLIWTTLLLHVVSYATPLRLVAHN